MRLRPLTATDIVDGALATIKAAPRAVIGVTAAFIVPAQLISTLIWRDQLERTGVVSAATGSLGASSSDLLSASSVALVALQSIALALAAAALAQLVWSWYEGKPISSGEAIKGTLRMVPALLVGWLLVHLSELAGLALFAVPLLFAVALGAVTVPVIAIERVGALAGVRRSWQLARTNLSGVIGIVLLVGVVDLVLSFSLSGLAIVSDQIIDTFGLDGAWVVAGVVQVATTMVTGPFVAAAALLLYLDLRVRSEGLDIELAVTEHFA